MLSRLCQCLVGCETVLSGRNFPTLRGNLLSVSYRSRVNSEAAGSFETSVNFLSDYAVSRPKRVFSKCLCSDVAFFWDVTPCTLASICLRSYTASQFRTSEQSGLHRHHRSSRKYYAFIPAYPKGKHQRLPCLLLRQRLDDFLF
jgi:hypothetical protein